MVADFHRGLAPALIRRFSEREDNVRADVLQAYIVLLRQTRPPRVWLEASDELAQSGAHLQLLRGQVTLPVPLCPCLPGAWDP